MKGNNTLLLNAATVIDALNEYFARRTTSLSRFKVTSIKESSTMPAQEFRVDVTAQPLVDEPHHGNPESDKP